MKTIANILGQKGGTRFLRFLLVGFSGLLVNTGLLAFSVEWLGIHYLAGAFIATQGSTLWNYLWTEFWVFGIREKQEPVWKRLGGYYLMNNFFLLLRAPLLSLFTSVFGVNYLIGNLLSILILTLARFLISDRWIWRNKRMKRAPDNYFYNIHNLIYLSSSTLLPELEYFLSSSKPDLLDLRITAVNKHSLQKEQASIIYDEGFGNLGFWLYIHNGTPTEIYVSPMLEHSPHVLYTNVVEPLLRWEFVRKGYALIHGACLSYQGQGLLITAPTDTGKTTTILKCLENFPFEFVSDDMIIVGSDGSLLTYPKPMTISLHTVKAINKNTLTLWERSKLQVQSRLHSRLGRRIGLLFGDIKLPAATLNMYVQMLIPPPKYHVGRLIPHVKQASLSNLAYLVVINRGKNVIEKALPPNTISRIIAKNLEDAYGFPPYPIIVKQISRWGDQDLRVEENKLINLVMGHLPSIVISRPDYDWWKRIPTIFCDGQFNFDASVNFRFPRLTLNEYNILNKGISSTS